MFLHLGGMVTPYSHLVSSFRAAKLLAGLSAVFVIAVPGVSAQTRDFEPDRPLPRSSLTFDARHVDFSQVGNETAVTDLDFSGPSFGAMYAAPPEWRVTGYLFLGYGAESDGDKSFWEGELLMRYRLALGEPRRTEVFLMIPLLFWYRHLNVPDSPVSADALGVFRIGLGLGLGVNSRLGSRTLLVTRALPMATLTVNSKQQESLLPKVDVLFDGDALLHFERVLSDRVGLSLGFQIRVQRISLVSEDFFPSAPDSWVSFNSVEPGLRFGINW